MIELFPERLSYDQVFELAVIVSELGYNVYFGMDGESPVAIINALMDYKPIEFKRLSIEEARKQRFGVYSLDPINPFFEDLIAEYRSISTSLPTQVFENIHIEKINRFNRSFYEAKAKEGQIITILKCYALGDIAIFTGLKRIEPPVEMDNIAYTMK